MRQGKTYVENAGHRKVWNRKGASQTPSGTDACTLDYKQHLDDVSRQWVLVARPESPTRCGTPSSGSTIRRGRTFRAYFFWCRRRLHQPSGLQCHRPPVASSRKRLGVREQVRVRHSFGTAWVLVPASFACTGRRSFPFPLHAWYGCTWRVGHICLSSTEKSLTQQDSRG